MYAPADSPKGGDNPPPHPAPPAAAAPDTPAPPPRADISDGPAPAPATPPPPPQPPPRAEAEAAAAATPPLAPLRPEDDAAAGPRTGSRGSAASAARRSSFPSAQFASDQGLTLVHFSA